jgi:hypothetical protein
MLLVTSIASTAADYDPSRCPEAQAMAAGTVAAVKPGSEHSFEARSHSSLAACTVCCGSSPAFFAQPETEVSEPAHPSVVFAFSTATSPAGVAAATMLRPPRR